MTVFSFRPLALAVRMQSLSLIHILLDVIHAFEKACGKKLPYVIEARRPGDIAECYADPSKAKREPVSYTHLDVYKRQILCHMDGMVYQLIHTLVLGRGDGHHRDAQHGPVSYTHLDVYKRQTPSSGFRCHSL